MDDTAVTAEILKLARARGWKIATAESCTGGLLAGALTEIAGSSDVFDRGIITYSNDAKQQMLGVNADTLALFGAVSEQVAQEMAVGAMKIASADLTLSITGVAGPGASDYKPEGRVCFGLKAEGQPIFSETIEFGALGRKTVRQHSVSHALNLILRLLQAK